MVTQFKFLSSNPERRDHCPQQASGPVKVAWNPSAPADALATTAACVVVQGVQSSQIPCALQAFSTGSNGNSIPSLGFRMKKLRVWGLVRGPILGCNAFPLPVDRQRQRTSNTACKTIQAHLPAMKIAKLPNPETITS